MRDLGQLAATRVSSDASASQSEAWQSIAMFLKADLWFSSECHGLP